MDRRHTDPCKSKVLIFTFGIAALILLVTLLAMPAKADAVITYDNGYSLIVPDGWVVDVHPEEFNSLPYDAQTNPKGKLEGWGGWPWYDLYLQANYNCHPGELIISPGYCPPQPEFYLTPEPRVVECPVPEPEECHDNRGKQGEKCKKNKDD